MALGEELLKDSSALAKAALMKKLSGFEPEREDFKEVKKETTPEAIAAREEKAKEEAITSAEI